MSIESCLDRLANAGKITATQAADAKALFNRILNHDAFRAMDPTLAEAKAALETARILEAEAKRKKMALAQRVNKWIKNSARVDAHPNGPIAGYMALLDRDIRNAKPGEGMGKENVSSLAVEHYEPIIAAKMHEATHAYGSTMAGLKQDIAGVRNMIREMFGVETGDATAAKAAKGWKEATDWAGDKATAMGKVFTADEDWRLPQFWETKRVNKFGASEFKADLMREVEGDAMVVHHPDTGQILKGADREKVINEAIDHIRMDLTARAGPASVFKTEQRVFRFSSSAKGAEAYLRMMDKYGPGNGNYLSMMQGHASKMARELALLHVLGPNYRTASEALLKSATEKQARAELTPTKKTAWEKLGDALISPLEGRNAAGRLHRYMTGESSGVESEAVAGFFQGLRSFITSTSMGSAIVTAIPGDAVNWAMAANFRGLDGGRLASAIFDQLFADTPDKEAFATRLGITAHAATRVAIGTKQYGDQMFGSGVFTRMADFVIRAQGLHAWDSAINRCFTMEFLASIADRAGKSFDQLDKDFARFITDYGFTREEWEKLSKGDVLSAGAAKFLMPDSLEEGLRAKLMSAIGDEKQFAYLAGGSSRVRSFTAGDHKSGNLGGELLKNTFLFKTFAMSMLATHGVRAAQEASHGKWGQAAALGLFMTLAGAVSVQARQALQGKDPKDVKDGWFWLEAGLTGGALGPYGDILKGGTDANKSSLVDLVMGPTAQIPEALQDILSGARRDIENDEPFNYGRALARDIKKFTPGGNLWYSRLLANRFIFDNIQRQLDPDYDRSFQRAVETSERLNHQGFWWAPGESAPDKAPSMGAMLGK